MHVPSKLIATALAVGAALAVTSPAMAQDIANPVGTTFNGTNQGAWNFSVGARFSASCTTVALDGTPTPAGVGVVANGIGGPSTRMLRYAPSFSGCTASVNNGPAQPATVTAACDWGQAVDTYTAGNGTSRQRVAIGLGCADPSAALTVTAGDCSVSVAEQTITNQAGQNFGTAFMFTTVNAQQSLARTIDPDCALLQDPIPLASMSVTHKFPGISAS